MVDFIDRHKDVYGIEPICRVLQVAPSTYYAAKTRVPSVRTVRDAVSCTGCGATTSGCMAPGSCGRLPVAAAMTSVATRWPV